MSVSAIDQLAPTEPSLYTTEAPGSMGKDDFLKLLITQLQMQDPLNPQDPAEFTSQLTQFSNLEQMIGMNGSIAALKDQMIESLSSLQLLQAASNNTQAVSLIGKDVLFEGDTLQVKDGEAQNVRFYAPEDLHNTQATIYSPAAVSPENPSGLIRTVDLGTVGTGVRSYDWSTLGVEPPPDGKYTIKVTALNPAGTDVTVPTLTTGRVTGVAFEAGQTYLDAGDQRVALGDVFSVTEPTET